MSSPSSVQISSGGQSQKEPRNLGTFFSDKTLSDVVVKFGDQKIFAHRLILVKSSVWFEKALLGDFKESKQTVIDIGSDDDPAAVTAMLRFFYDSTYLLDGLDGDAAEQHLAMYRLADLYDAPDLRKEASHQLIRCFRATMPGFHNQSCLPDYVVQSIQHILGPDADTFADNSIQQDVFKFILEEANSLYKNELFQELLGSGSMFSEEFSRRFAQKTGELITRLRSRDPHTFEWGTPAAEPWCLPWSWDIPPRGLDWEPW